MKTMFFEMQVMVLQNDFEKTHCENVKCNRMAEYEIEVSLPYDPSGPQFIYLCEQCAYDAPIAGIIVTWHKELCGNG